MLEKLHITYPNKKFVLPDEFEIRCFVNALVSNTKKKVSDEDDSNLIVTTNDRGGEHRDGDVVFNDVKKKWLNDFLERDGNIQSTPRDLLDTLRNQFPEDTEHTNQHSNAIRAKISQIKAKVKNNAWKSII